MAVTAGQIISRIRQRIGTAWKSPSSERFECGSENANVTGILTAWTPSIEVLEKAVSLKHNLVISMEPPFWHEFGEVKAEVSYGRPTLEMLKQDRAFQFKKKLIDDNGIVIWRFHENYVALPENPRLHALAEVLGMKGREDAAATRKRNGTQSGVYAISETTLRNLAKQAHDLAGAKTLRALGDPQARIRRVALAPGYMTNQRLMDIVRGRDVDAVICGDACQWESFEYAEDWIDAGWGKAMILLGQAASESPGGKAMAGWLSSFIADVPVTGVACGECYQFVAVHNA